MGLPRITTVGERLYWTYANLAMAHAALEEGASEYGKPHFRIRARLYSGLRRGEMTLGSYADDERVKMMLPKACCYCGSRDSLSVDHLLPRRLGGPDSGDNMVWACRSCNSSKGDTDLVEWMLASGRFPPLLLLRRYLKLAIEWCHRGGFMGAPIDEVEQGGFPFSFACLPRGFPPPRELRLWSVDLDDGS